MRSQCNAVGLLVPGRQTDVQKSNDGFNMSLTLNLSKSVE